MDILNINKKIDINDISYWKPFVPEYGDNFFVAIFPDTDITLPQSICTGWEIRTSDNYKWYGQSRIGPCGSIQYTTRGRGNLVFDGISYDLLPGQAFLIENPGNYCYSLPSDSSEWEFIFITFDGKDALQHLHQIIDKTGPIVTLGNDHMVVNLLLHVGYKIANNDMNTPEDGAEWLYRIMMQLRKTTVSALLTQSTILQKVLNHMYQHFADENSCTDLASIAGISQAQLYRYFKTNTGYAPGQYLTILRLRHALFYLRNTNQSADEIGRRCGFKNGWYLGRVCRKVLGNSPSAFKNGVVPPPESGWKI